MSTQTDADLVVARAKRIIDIACGHVDMRLPKTNAEIVASLSEALLRVGISCELTPHEFDAMLIQLLSDYQNSYNKWVKKHG